jgi:hypothetical protein
MEQCLAVGDEALPAEGGYFVPKGLRHLGTKSSKSCSSCQQLFSSWIRMKNGSRNGDRIYRINRIRWKRTDFSHAGGLAEKSPGPAGDAKANLLPPVGSETTFFSSRRRRLLRNRRPPACGYKNPVNPVDPGNNSFLLIVIA